MKVLAEELEPGDILEGKGSVLTITRDRLNGGDRVVVCVERTSGQAVVEFAPGDRVELLSPVTAAPCPATREAVEEQDFACPLCGKPPGAHKSESAALDTEEGEDG